MPVNPREGCGSHSCMFVKALGQGTNGSCTCIGAHMSSAERLRVRKNVRIMQEEIDQYKKALRIIGINYPEKLLGLDLDDVEKLETKLKDILSGKDHNERHISMDDN